MPAASATAKPARALNVASVMSSQTPASWAIGSAAGASVAPYQFTRNLSPAFVRGPIVMMATPSSVMVLPPTSPAATS